MSRKIAMKDGKASIDKRLDKIVEWTMQDLGERVEELANSLELDADDLYDEACEKIIKQWMAPQ